MQTFLLLCVGLGAAVLVGQILLGSLGFESQEDHAVPGGSHAALGLELLSVRSLAAALAMFGAAGLAFDGFLPGWIAVILALGPAWLAAWGTARLMRLLVRADSSGTLDLDGAIGAVGTVYLRVPAGGDGPGLVQVALQGRTVELRAVTRAEEALPTGSNILVISVDSETETVEVVPTTKIEELT